MEHLHDENIHSMISLTPLQSWSVILMVLILSVIILFEMRIASQQTALDEGELSEADEDQHETPVGSGSYLMLLPGADETSQRPHLTLIQGGLDPNERPYDWAVDGI